MRKYLYLIKKKKIKSWLKFWLLTNNKFNIILSSIIEGTSFNLQNTVKRYFKIFNIFGNSVQDGTPTPENPIEINSVADDVNLFDYSKITNFSGDTVNGTLLESYSNGVKVQGNVGTTPGVANIANGWFRPGNHYDNRFIRISVEEGTDIYISVDVTLLNQYNNNSNKMRIYFYGASNYNTEVEHELILNQKVRISQKYTVTQTGTYYPVFTLNSNTLLIENIKISTSSNIAYSPYNYGTFTIDFEGQTENYNYTFITSPLRSLPNGVRDSLEDDGIHRRVGRVVLDGTETWIENSNWNYTNTNCYIYSLGITNNNIISNYFIYNGGSYYRDISGIMGIVQGNRLLFRISNTIANSKSEFQAWLSTHNTEVLYPLTEEVIEPYTEEQQEQYNKIKELYTFDGTTNIYSDDEVPPYLQIQYYMKGE